MVLALYVLSLHRYVTFCAEHALHHKIEFVPTMCQLVSSRPHVCTDAMLVNSELEVLILNELTRAFDNAMNETGQKENDTSEDIAVALDIPVLDGSAKNVTLPACLLKAAVVVVSNWQSGASDDECKSNTIEKRIGLNAENSSFERLLWYIIPPTDDKASQKASGLASAVYSDDAPAASIEDVSVIRSIASFSSALMVILFPIVDLSGEGKVVHCCKARGTLCPRCIFAQITTQLWNGFLFIFHHASPY